MNKQGSDEKEEDKELQEASGAEAQEYGNEGTRD